MTPEAWIAFGGLAVVIIAGLIDIRVKVSRIEDHDKKLDDHDEQLTDHRGRIMVLESRRAQ